MLRYPLKFCWNQNLITDRLEEKTSYLCFLLHLHDDEERRRRKERREAFAWNQRKVEQGIYGNLFYKLLDSISLRHYIRLDIMLFDYLVETLYPYHWYATRKFLGQGWFLEIGALRKTFHIRHKKRRAPQGKRFGFFIEGTLKTAS